MIRLRSVLWAFLLFIAAVPASGADVPAEIARDFAPLSGYVVMPSDGEFLIDRGAEDGIAAGDLFSVVHPGERIVHPVTGKELGSLDRVKGLLRVVRVRPGYSHASPVEAREPIGKGDVVRRFDRIPAVFVDTTGGGRTFYERLRTVLPGLEWRFVTAPSSAAETLPEVKVLAFVLADGKLEVRDREQLLRSYAFPAESVGKPPAGEFTVLGELPAGTSMADFVRDGERLLLAVTDGARIDVYAVGDRPVPLGSGAPPRSGRVHGLHWWKPRPDGAPMLAATVSVDENQPFGPTIGQTVIGVIFTVTDGRLAQIPEELPYLLGSFDRDGDGVPETLLGQSFDRDVFFGDRIREIHLKDGRPVAAGPSFPIPRSFPVQGTAFADLTGDGRPETVVVRTRKLSIFDGAQLLYESSEQMGGSLSVLTYDLNPGARDRQFTTAAFEVAPIIIDPKGSGRKKVVAIASEGPGVSGLGSGVRKSWLATLEYRGGRFIRGTIGRELETPLQGLHASRDGVFVVATEPSSLWGKKKESRLLFLPFRSGGE
ncbi:MAG: hypothetical protein AB1346_04100 [Thermodesulfobacteriota bacterium]